MSNYYTKQDAKVRIAHELMKMGWNVEGYHADESDSMTDYYSPAHWYGIATKNGYVLVVDNDCVAKSKEITKLNPKGNLSFEDREKITKLEEVTTERGATEKEAEEAQRRIEKIKSKITDHAQYEVVGYTTAHLGNPKGSIWHIEKDGKIYDKGNALTKFADVPESYEFDINKMEYTERYSKEWTGEIGEYGERIKRQRELPDETRKIINDFKALILRFERVVNGMNSCGDGTKETEEAGKEQQVKAGFEKVTVTEYKEEIKVNEIEKPIEIKEGMYFILKTSFNHGCSKGTVYKINSVRENPYNHKFYIDANRMNRKLNKVLTGNATTANSFDVELSRLTEWIDKCSIAIVELITVNTPYEVEKWVKIDKSKKAYNTTKKAEQEETEKEHVTEPQEQTNETILNHEITITADTDTRDNSNIWIVKLVNRVNSDEFKRIKFEVMKPIQGYYSPFKGGFLFKYDPTSILKPEAEQTAEEITETENISNEQEVIKEDAYKTEEIKEGYIYNCHFKSWNMSIEDIKSYLKVFEIPYIISGEKLIFKMLTAEQTKEVKEISDINDSIFFIDNEISITDVNSVTDKQPQNIDITEVTANNEGNSNVIDFEEYKNNSEVTEMHIDSNSNDFNFDDILNQFDNIEINNNSCISADDEQFCKEQENQYNEFIKYSDDYIQYLKDNIFSNPYLSSNSLINEMNKQRESNKNWFITKLVNYFKDKYKVTLTSNTIEKKYSIDIDYNTIVTEIIDQLGGYSFTDKADKELKDEFINLINHNRIEIKNKKISMDSFFYAESWDYGNGKHFKVSYSYDTKFNKMFKSFSHFLFKSYENYFKSLYTIITCKEDEEVFKTHEISNTGIIALKLYKNGKIDIEFSSSEYARKFAKEYCGYIEKAS